MSTLSSRAYKDELVSHLRHDHKVEDPELHLQLKPDLERLHERLAAEEEARNHVGGFLGPLVDYHEEQTDQLRKRIEELPERGSSRLYGVLVSLADVLEAIEDDHARMVAGAMTQRSKTLTEAGAILGVAPVTLRGQITKGRLEATLVGKTYVVTDEEIERYRRESLGKPGQKVEARP